jgi:hypothetical protein
MEILFDRLLIAPSPVGLAQALADASRAASRGRSASPRDAAGALNAVLTTPEGRRLCDFGRTPELTLPATNAINVVEVAWWSDFGGRRHVRLRGGRGLPPSPLPGESMLLHVYPGSALRWERGGRATAVVHCDCGTWGEPESLGWMGDCCGPCHDRGDDALPARRAAWRLPGAALGELLLSPDGASLARLGLDDELSVWDALSGELRARSQMPRRQVTRLLALADGGGRAALLMRGPARVVAVWGLDGPRELGRLPRGGGQACFAPDGAALLVTDANGAAFWRFGAAPVRLDGAATTWPSGPSIAVSPDGQIAAAYDSQGLRLWLLPSGQPLADLPGATGSPTWNTGQTVSFSPDGSLLCLARSNASGVSEVLFYGVATQGPAQPVSLPGVPTFYPRLGPDNRTLLAHCLGGDGRSGVVAWDAATGVERGRLSWAGTCQAFAALRPDGSLLTVAHGDRAVRVWPAEALLGGTVV